MFWTKKSRFYLTLCDMVITNSTWNWYFNNCNICIYFHSIIWKDIARFNFQRWNRYAGLLWLTLLSPLVCIYCMQIQEYIIHWGRYHSMVTSSNGNIFRVTGSFWRELTGDRWVLLTKASDAKLWCFLWSAPEQSVEQTREAPVIWVAIVPIMTSLYWHTRDTYVQWYSSANSYIRKSVSNMFAMWSHSMLYSKATHKCILTTPYNTSFFFKDLSIAKGFSTWCA